MFVVSFRRGADLTSLMHFLQSDMTGKRDKIASAEFCVILDQTQGDGEKSRDPFYVIIKAQQEILELGENTNKCQPVAGVLDSFGHFYIQYNLLLTVDVCFHIREMILSILSILSDFKKSSC